MTGSTDPLISALVDDLEPIRPLPRLRSAFAVVLAVWASVLGVVLLTLQHEPGGRLLLASPVYFASFAGLVVAALGGTLSALAAGRPGRTRLEVGGLVVCLAGLLAAAAACLIAMAGLDFGAQASPPGRDAMCFRTGALLSLLPAGAVLSFLVRGWTARPIRAALVAAIAAGAFGASVVHLSCDLLGPRHLLLGHLGVPVVLGALALYPLGILLRRLRG